MCKRIFPLKFTLIFPLKLKVFFKARVAPAESQKSSLASGGRSKIAGILEEKSRSTVSNVCEKGKMSGLR